MGKESTVFEDELLWIEEQLPQRGLEGDVFNAHLDDQPRKDFGYMFLDKPSQKDTVTVSLEKKRYLDLPAARARAAELFILRKLKPYHAFQTARYFCWYCTNVQ